MRARLSLRVYSIYVFARSDRSLGIEKCIQLQQSFGPELHYWLLYVVGFRKMGMVAIGRSFLIYSSYWISAKRVWQTGWVSSVQMMAALHFGHVRSPSPTSPKSK